VAGALLLAQLGGGGTSTGRAIDQLNRSSTRPLPALPPAPSPRNDMIWVPEQHTPPSLGAPQGFKVPGHWERQLPDGTLYAPPLVVCEPGSGACRTVPAGPQPSIDQRQVP
jgi:hypothetical protein